MLIEIVQQIESVECELNAVHGWNVCVQGKANMEKATAKSNTALLLAVNNGQTPLIELLVNQGNYISSNAISVSARHARLHVMLMLGA